MIIGKIYKRIALLSPWVEVTLRKFYWKNVKFLKKFKPYSPVGLNNGSLIKFVDFNDVIEYLKCNGVCEGSLLVVHSSYDALECTGLAPEEIIEKLLNLIGPSGTLAMPVIRKFKGEPKTVDVLTTPMDNVVCTYDVKRTKITSGMLPYFLMRRDDSVTSLFPLNPMCAVGPLANEMMLHNLDGDCPSPHGPVSSWKFCYDHNAIIVGLGVTLEHYNTSVHVAEEAFGDWYWSEQEWYRKRCFTIIDKQGKETEKIVYERKPRWGTLHCAELNLHRDLNKAGIVIFSKIDDVIPMAIEKQQELITFLRSKNKKGYPYY